MKRKDFDTHYGNKLHDLLFRWVDIRKISLIKKHVSGKNLIIGDFGCGAANISSTLTDNHTVYGVDLNDRLLKIAKKRGLNTVRSLFEKTPFEDGFFDVLIMIDSIEHIHSRNKLAKELKRIIKNKGKLIIFTPAYDSITWNTGEKFVNLVTRKKSDHTTPFTKESIEFFLEKNNFKIKELKRINFGLGLFIVSEKIR